MLDTPRLLASEIDGPSEEGPWVVRTYRHGDRPKVLELYESGLLPGQLEPHEAIDDLTDVGRHYLRRQQDCFWIAESGGGAVGMVGLVEGDRLVSHVRRLRVSRPFQTTRLARRLVEYALHHAREHGSLKVVLHNSPRDACGAVPLFGALGFTYAGEKTVDGRRVLEFYVDLYRKGEPKAK